MSKKIFKSKVYKPKLYANIKYFCKHKNVIYFYTKVGLFIEFEHTSFSLKKSLELVWPASSTLKKKGFIHKMTQIQKDLVGTNLKHCLDFQEEQPSH
ncbi:MAG: hypothetical protein Q8872_03220, partial [Candidatus Phytoplasma australasiaticum]|nr:hypothetical protein [Candidatus Phytoplasma australasiaticum]